MFDLGQRYPFLEDDELDYLEGLYSSMEERDQNLIQDLILRLYGDQKRSLKIF